MRSVKSVALLLFCVFHLRRGSLVQQQQEQKQTSGNSATENETRPRRFRQCVKRPSGCKWRSSETKNKTNLRRTAGQVITIDRRGEETSLARGNTIAVAQRVQWEIKEGSEEKKTSPKERSKKRTSEKRRKQPPALATAEDEEYPAVTEDNSPEQRLRRWRVLIFCFRYVFTCDDLVLTSEGQTQSGP